MDQNSIIIIGGGFAGLSAGIYAQMNGYNTHVFEMHDKPGGLCTSWKRKGYTIDGCIHWLTGSSPLSGMNRYWQEVGVAQGRAFINADEYYRHEAADGRTLIFYTDIDRLQKHLLEFSPQDELPVRDFIKGVRMSLSFDQPSEIVPLFQRIKKGLQLAGTMIAKGGQMKKWMKTTIADFAGRFKDPVMREAFLEMWIPEFSIFFMMFALGYLHNKNAGYPIGGSRPMSEAMEKRFTSLGGIIHYKKRVEKIIVEGDKAVGVSLADGSVFRANRVISGADGYTTIFKMLEGKYADDKTREPYENWPLFSSLLFIGLGVNRSFKDEPVTVSGLSFPLKQPVKIGNKEIRRLPVHFYNQDATLAPAGKTTVVVLLESDYEYWKELAKDRKAYDDEKEQTAKTVIELLELRFPGISGDVEMSDVATPLTFERYTGNWKGSFEGWLITPGNSRTMIKPMKQTLPGLQNFYQCGQWVVPGGGLPSGVMSARGLLKSICKEDGKKFVTTIL